MHLFKRETVERFTPNHVKILMAALYCWAFILLQLNILGNLMLRLMITVIPNLILPNIVPDTPIRIVKAFDQSGFDITKKLNIFMNFKWDAEMSNENGGIDLDAFCEYIGSSIIWICYTLEQDISIESCNKFLNFIKNVESTADDSETNKIHNLNGLKKHMRTIVVNTTKKLIYKLKQNSCEVSPEDIVFGEVDFF